jgi:glycosyltransferase involved in cell wall biosynthesis
MNADHNSRYPDAPSILCIGPSFAPKRDSEAFCTAKFIKALAECGAQITVIVSAKTETDIDRSEMWNSVRARVVRIPPRTQRNLFASAAAALRYHAWYARWLSDAVRQAKQLHQGSPFDIVYSRSPPMHGHMAGYWCAKELTLPWVANLNDPWEFHQFPVGISVQIPNKRYIALSNFWMRRTLRHADLITYPSDRLYHYQRTFSAIPHQSQIFPHVGNSQSMSGGAEVSGSSANFHLIHAGKLGSNEFTGRSTAALLEGLQLFLNECEDARHFTSLTLVGPEDLATQAHVRRLGLDGTVVSVGRIDYEDSLKYIESASVCVLVEADMPEGIFLPSKLADYISARKPILAMSPRVGVVADLEPGGGITRVDPGDACGVRDAIRGLYIDFRRGTLARRSPSGFQVDQFRPEVVANRFLKTLRELVAAKKEGKPQRA